MPTILAWRRAGKIGQRQHNEPETKPSGSLYSSLAQSVEHAAVNRRVVGSSPTWGAYREEPPRGVDVAALFLKGLWAFSSVG